jgi:hypothetical protein
MRWDGKIKSSFKISHVQTMPLGGFFACGFEALKVNILG